MPWPSFSAPKANHAPLLSTMPAGVDAEVDEFPGAGNARAPDDVELGFAEGRGHRVLDHLHAGKGAVGFFLVLEGLDLADVEAHGGVELERVAAGGRLRAAVARRRRPSYAQLVDEDARRCGTCGWCRSACGGRGTSGGPCRADVRCRPSSPSSSAWGTRAATESMTTRSTAPERTSAVGRFPGPARPWSGCET